MRTPGTMHYFMYYLKMFWAQLDEEVTEVIATLTVFAWLWLMAGVDL